ncbi:asparagine synthase (glutamine-hydrolyzing) [Streptomyces sp. NPDC001262]|uniref:asparagine synthase (glutamine-hydrolyzing) n=1 Tax=Streptomyces sp. NPDC001262 TaxID=3364552 RepID=UPI00368E4B93
MCGLAGIAAIGGRKLPESSQGLLRRMTGTLAHRGPDETAYARTGPVGLGFVRLALVDPEGGGQPLSTPDGSLVLIANGEIYNHRELAAGLPADARPRTGSDCEVLLELYRRDGLDFLDRVRGMFAVVLFDRDRNRLVVARDRFGVKPLFFHANAERIVLASEIKALFDDPDCPRELDWEQALADQMMTCDPVLDDSPAHSWFKGVEPVPAASVLVFDLGTGARTVHRYWEFPAFDGARTGSESELVGRYAGILAASVQECRTGDAGIGLFLSGGIDSVAIAALAGSRLPTFTALNGSTLLNTDAEYAHRFARLAGLDNHQVLFDTAAVPGVAEWKRLLWLLETPLAGPEAYYKHELYRYARAQYPGMKAMLLGIGSDEFNGGYSHMLAPGGRWADFMAGLHRRGVRSDRRLAPGMGAWWDRSGPSLVRTEALRAAAGGIGPDPYEGLFRWKYRELQMYNCWHEDRTAAGNGMEARVPFLDHRLVELTAAVPEELRPSLIWDKQILRRGLAGVLPPEFIARPKIPFFLGKGLRHTCRSFAAMLAQQGDALVEEALSSPRARDYLDADHVRSTLRGLEADPGSGDVEFLLGVVNLGLLDAMCRELPGPHADAPPAALPRSVPVTDWDGQAEEIEDAVLHDAPVSQRAVLARAENVLLLNAPQAGGAWFVAVDRTLTYVIDPVEDADWLALLRALDGRRTLAEVAADADVELAELEDVVADALEAGLLTDAGSDR